MNNKGFMLAEVIIVASIILTVLVTMYMGLNRLYVKYSERTKYYNIDAIYASKTMADYLIDSYQINGLVTSTDNTSIKDINTNIRDNYAVTQMYFIPKDNLSKFSPTNTDDNSVLSNYITYLKNNNNNATKNLIVTEIKDNNSGIYYYGYVVIE